VSKSDAIGEGRAGTRAQSRLDRLYRRYSPWLTARLRRRYGADAEDIVQDAWLRLAPIDAGLEIRSPKAFLLTLASNIAMSRARRDRRRSEILDAEAPTQARAQSPDQIDAVLLEEIILGLPQPLRDRIVVGEMRDGAAALETLKSWNTGHPGGLSTIHANSIDDVLRRVEDLTAEVSANPSRRAIGQTIDRIVHISRISSGRRVEAILAVDGYRDDAYQLRRLG